MSKARTTKLLVPQKEAEKKIKGQIQEGRLILQSVAHAQAGLDLGPERIFDKAEAEREKWAKFTLHLLQTLFTDDSAAHEFGNWWVHYGGHVDNITLLIDSIKTKIVRLESLVQRLPLFSVQETTAGGATAAIPKYPAKSLSKDIFIVHGHDEAAKHEVARFIEHLGLRPIILHEQADRGRTIIEKFEDHSNVGFAVILLTPDDVGFPQEKPADRKPRARQNVLFEVGFFIGSLGRGRVCVLRKGDIETPTDYSGVLYKTMDQNGAWKLELAREIQSAGIELDLKRTL